MNEERHCASRNVKKDRNDLSKLIGQKKRNQEDCTTLMEQVGDIGNKIQDDDQKLVVIEKKIEQILLVTPNILHESVPFGRDEKDNVEIKKYLEPTTFPFKPKPHYELGEALDIIDFGAPPKLPEAVL